MAEVEARKALWMEDGDILLYLPGAECKDGDLVIAQYGEEKWVDHYPLAMGYVAGKVTMFCRSFERGEAYHGDYY